MLPNLSSPRSERNNHSSISTRVVAHEIKMAASRPGIDYNNKRFLEDYDRARTAKVEQQRQLSAFLSKQMHEHDEEKRRIAQSRQHELEQTVADRQKQQQQAAEAAAEARHLQETLRAQQAALTKLLNERQQRERERDQQSESKVTEAARLADAAAERKAKADFDLAIQRQEELIRLTRSMLQRKQLERSAERARGNGAPDHFVVRHHDQERAAFDSFLKAHAERSAEPKLVPEMSLSKELKYPELQYLPSHATDQQWRQQWQRQQEEAHKNVLVQNNSTWTADMTAHQQAKERLDAEKQKERFELDRTIAFKKQTSDFQRMEDQRWKRVYAQQLECQLRLKTRQDNEHLFSEHSLSRTARH